MPADGNDTVSPADGEEAGIPLFEERLSVGTHAEHRHVRVTTAVRTHEAAVERELEDEEVEIVRVPVDRPVDAVPEPRREGDVLIVPLVEERLVVTKQLVLREEIHIRKRTTRRIERVTGTVRSQDAVVTRADAADAADPTHQE